jgi:hypothetical protein
VGSRPRPAGSAAEGTPRPEDGRPSWADSFATTTHSWRVLGGFDEGGSDREGAVEADFGRRLGAAEGTMLWLGGAVAYRQPDGRSPRAGSVGGSDGD